MRIEIMDSCEGEKFDGTPRVTSQEGKDFCLIDINFGNTGLQINYIGGTLETPQWRLNFQPEQQTTSKIGKRIKFTRMFSTGMVSLVNFFTSPEKYSTSISLSSKKILDKTPEKVEFFTNETMAKFFLKIIGNEYVVFDIKLKVNGSEKISGYFLLDNFIQNYIKHPEISTWYKKLSALQ